jgi:hypothetical protein
LKDPFYIGGARLKPTPINPFAHRSKQGDLSIYEYSFIYKRWIRDFMVS